MRSVFTICILIIQLLAQFSADAATPVHDVSQQENAVISAFSLHHGHPAEVARPIQLHCTAFKLRTQRLLDGLLLLTNPGSYIGDVLCKHANIAHVSIWFPSVSLLLFPSHYFW